MSELREPTLYTKDILLEDVPGKAVSEAEHCLLDPIGSAIGAARYEENPATAQRVLGLSDGDAGNHPSSWGHNQNAPGLPAILLIGKRGAINASDDLAGKGLNTITGEPGAPFSDGARDYKARNISWVAIRDWNCGEGQIDWFSPARQCTSWPGIDLWR